MLAAAIIILLIISGVAIGIRQFNKDEKEMCEITKLRNQK